jgi:hypothetical protein
MAIYEVTKDRLREVAETNFSAAGIRERADLQRVLREQIGIISTETMIIAEEFGEWEDSRRRIDLLGLDKNANLIVIELKRTDDGGHMELQALRYAAMVSAMTFDQAVEAYEAYLEAHGRQEDAREAILNFLEWEEPDEDNFAQDTRIVLVSAEFSKELTTSVMWLNERGLEIRCVRLKPYKLEGRTLVDVQQVIPLPEAVQYQVQIREKKQQERKARSQKWDQTSFLTELGRSAGAETVDVFTKIHAWMVPLVDEISWGTIQGRFVPTVCVGGLRIQLFVIRADAKVAIRFMYLRKRPPFTERGIIDELLRKVNEIPGVNFPPDAVGRKPNFPLDLLAAPEGLEEFKKTVEWMIDQLRTHNQARGN